MKEHLMQEDPGQEDIDQVEVPPTPLPDASGTGAGTPALSLTPEEVQQLTESLDPSILALLSLC